MSENVVEISPDDAVEVAVICLRMQMALDPIFRSFRPFLSEQQWIELMGDEA